MWFRWAAGIAAVAAGAAWLGYDYGLRKGRIGTGRGGVLWEQSAKVRPGGAVVLGDSNVELQIFATLCGKPVLNAGISGIRTAALIEPARMVIRRAEPAVTIVAVGVNDSARLVATSPADFAHDYARLLAAVKRGGRLIVVGIPPIEPGKRWGSGFDEARISAFNALLPKVAAEGGATFVPALGSTTGLTFDGLHFNAAGDRAWQASIEAACR
ncbi:hypothetical protein FHS96_002636 [Sphingomonas zeicaulis]|uniref:SGNH/GDSL hydrolase family protein n=1 Tax=Sphingomonas zeicaulis TaxID=1632740 RepID=UPI003D1E2FEB